jgi:pSer/pThr/pTyr-binding forkhead associated (FHA) protein
MKAVVMNAGESQYAAAARRELIQLVAVHGPGLLDDSRRVRAMLADAVAGATAEANLIGLALSSGVPAKLREAAVDPARSGAAVAESAEHLQRTSSVQRADALWAVTAIAEALGVSSTRGNGRDPGSTTSRPVGGTRPDPAAGGTHDLVVAVGAQERTVSPGTVVTIGRDPSSTLTLESSAVSRHHGRVQHGSSGWEYVDLDSTQGSHVDGVRVRTHALRGETTVTLGQGADAVRLRLTPLGRAATVFPPPVAMVGARPTEVPLRPGGALGGVPAARTEVGRAAGPALTVSINGSTRTVPAGTTLTIGREADNGLVATGTTVSRHHVHLECGDGGWRLRDLGSTSGTWLDGGRVSDVRLVGRQEFVLGDLEDGDRMVTQAPGTVDQPARVTGAPDRRRRRFVPVLAAVAVAAVFALGAGFVVWQNVGGDEDESTVEKAPLTPGQLAAKLAKGTVLLKWSDPKFVHSGSGTVIDKEQGLILTNAHVAAPASVGSAIRNGYVFFSAAVKNPTSIEVFVAEGVGKPAQPKFTAKVVAVDGYLDLAVLKIDRTTVGAFPEPEDLAALTEIPIGDSDSLGPTDELTVIGYPAAQESLGPTYGTAVVSGWTGDDRIGSNKAYINSTDAVAHGNSGGLAADAEGNLVGVPSRLRADNLARPGSTADYTTVGAAMRPVNLAAKLIEAARAGAAYKSPYAVAAPRSAKILGVDPTVFVEPGDPGSISGSGKCNSDTGEYPNWAFGVRYRGFSGGPHTDVLAVFSDPETGDVLSYAVTPWRTSMPKNGCLVITTTLTTLPDRVELTIAVGGDVVPIWKGTLG